VQLLALLATGGACAQGITPLQVQQECVRQMEIGICRTVPDAASIPANKTMLIAGVGRVSYAAYMDYLKLFDKKKPFDTAMCRLALHYMTTAPGTDHDKIARALWTPAPP
jgi:hypothetical protein